MSDLYVSGTWRYRITVDVETPEGIKSGSAVREVSNSKSSIEIMDFPQAGNPAEVRGKAVVVDLGEHGILFALIEENSETELYEAFPTSGETTIEGIKHFNALEPGMKAEIKRNIPTMVTFTDITDPKSVKKVDPDNLEAAFGKGVKLKRVTVEITDEPVTWERIDHYLPEGARKLNMTYSYFSWPNVQGNE